MPSIATDASNDRMSALFLLRHGPTEWTAARRLQGRSDVPLSAIGRDMVATWHLPERAERSDWISSPLARAMATAEILRHRYHPAGNLLIEPRLVEMNFGEWEGQTLTALRSIHGPAMAEWEGKGLDFRAPGGESPREVQARLRPWLEQLTAVGRDVLAITHKGVMRALYALAGGWDMRGKPPHRLADNSIHLFDLDRDGLRIVTLNIAMRQRGRTAGAPL